VTSSGRGYWHELARALRQPHEAWLVMGTLGPAWGGVYRAVAHDVADERATNPPRRRSDDYVLAVKALNYFSISARGVLGLLCAALFIVVALTGDSWLAEVALAVGWIAALGAATCLVRIGLVSRPAGRPSRLLEPWNGDLLWQLAVVSALIFWMTR